MDIFTKAGALRTIQEALRFARLDAWVQASDGPVAEPKDRRPIDRDGAGYPDERTETPHGGFDPGGTTAAAPATPDPDADPPAGDSGEDATGPAETPATPSPDADAPAGDTGGDATVPARPAAAVSVAEARFLEREGFFERTFYLAQCSPEAGTDPFEHFLTIGCEQGLRPNLYFDPHWYAWRCGDAIPPGMNSLLHYVRYGEREGRDPSELFDTSWYRARYEIGEGESPLLHFLRNRGGGVSPNRHFDAKFYLARYPDVAAAGLDPFGHYLRQGFKEGRNPSATFDNDFYRRRYMKGDVGANPLVHFRRHGAGEDRQTQANDDDTTAAALVRRFSRPGPHFEPWKPLASTSTPRAKILCYYLTQFHQVPENDRWWGTGFTEWTNLARGQPRFRDHYQPRAPRDLGFYSLDDINVMHRQAEIAKRSGIYGFVFYYYAFGNKRLLERPLENFLNARAIDMPFCLMWANETWTRRWDGLEGEVLIAQDHAHDDDDALCADFARHFRDPRYIRLEGRPLLMIYRPGLIPEAAQRIENWRRIFESRFDERPILVMGQSFGDVDPRTFGVDGAIEFPPHKLTQDMRELSSEFEVIDHAFSGKIYSYDQVVAASLNERPGDFPLIKTVFPGWDNDARRQGTGVVVHGSTPAGYERWLSALIDRAIENPFFGEPMVCVNAWNEWCEAAYLEPDLHFGSAYLNATARAAIGLSPARPKLALVGHDLFPSGAQQLLLNIGRTLVANHGLEIEFVTLDDGELRDDYREVAPLQIARGERAEFEAVAGLVARGFRHALVNSCASGDMVERLKGAGFSVVLLVHELPGILNEKSIEAKAKSGVENADLVVFPADIVKRRVLEALGLGDQERFKIQPQGSYKWIAHDRTRGLAVRAEFEIPDSALLVLGAGYADLRKGFDLFLQAWRLARPRAPSSHFCWIGGIDPTTARTFEADIKAAKQTKTFHMPGFRDDADAFYSAADAFFLTSREDPFPTVALEALSAGVPVVAFEDSGGIPELLSGDALVCIVPRGDVEAMTAQLPRAVAARENRKAVERAIARVRESYDFDAYVQKLFSFSLPGVAKVSVAVPNYNYEKYIGPRLDSIFEQDHPLWEVAVLDDASTDNSLQAIHKWSKARGRGLSLIVNERNSGSAFRQWTRAAEAATGEFLWIAEADDLAEPTFLTALLRTMRADPDIVVGFSDSRSIDADGKPVYPSYKPYFATVEPRALAVDGVFDGAEFIARYLSVKNLILNASSVLWRREPLLAALKRCKNDLADLRMAGDWRLYMDMLTRPGARVAYVAAPLNVHRRHAQSVTHALDGRRHVDEIARMHEAARNAVILPESALKAQENYEREVEEQLIAETRMGARSNAPSLRQARHGGSP